MEKLSNPFDNAWFVQTTYTTGSCNEIQYKSPYKFCKCGQILNLKWNFCPYCGEKINGTNN